MDKMLGVLVVAAVSILIPLSLCLVPSFARYTVFPLLSKLIYRFASTYVLPCLEVEYAFGSFSLRGKAQQVRETLSGVSIILKKIQVQPDFLKTLAFERKGLAPVILGAVGIKEVSVHVTSSWRVVLEIDNVDVEANFINPNGVGDTAIADVKDAVAIKVAEVTGWIARFTAQKAKDEHLEQVANMPESQKVFAFKDRVMQLVVAQIDIQVRKVTVNVNSCAPSGQTSVARVCVAVDELAVESGVIHENREEGLELILISPDIREFHKIRIDEFSISAGKVKVTPEGATIGSLVKLLDIPSIELNLEAPPMARLAGLVPNYAPIPLEKRMCRVQLVLPANNRIVVAKEELLVALKDIFMPFADYQVAIKTLRVIEQETSAKEPMSEEDITFYLENYKRAETDTSLSAANKAALLEKLQALEVKMSLDEVMKARTQSLGLGKHFGEKEQLDLADCISLANKLATKLPNIMFSEMQIALRLERFALEFTEDGGEIGELSFNDFGVNVQQFTLEDGTHDQEKLLRNVDVTLEQAIFSIIPPGWTLGPSESPTSKLLFADFSHVPTAADSIIRPQHISAKVVQYNSGKQKVEAALNGLQIVASSEELEYFLLFVDRLTTDAGKIMAGVRPQPALREHEELSTSVEEAEPQASTDAGDVNLAPFSVLGGMAMELDVALRGCRIRLLPVDSLTDAVFRDHDASPRRGSSKGKKSEIYIPIDLQLQLDSSKTKEAVALEVQQFGVVAVYRDIMVSAEEDVEYLLAPAALSLAFTLEVDASNSKLTHQNVTAKMPDFVLSFSDLSLMLLSSCSKALSGIKTTTPEQAQLRLESRQKQEELQKQAQVDAILGRIQRMFDDIDVDKNGHIDMGELLNLLRRAKVGDTLLERELEYFVRVLFKEIDRDGNGYIEFDELRAYLRFDLLGGEGTAMSEVAGSAELEGYLNLRGGEYRSMDEVEKLCGTKPSTREQLEEFVEKPVFKNRFWDLYQSEIRSTKTSLNGQRPLEVQKQLVRLLKNYDAAKLSWNLIVLPELETSERLEWMLQPTSHCGGVSEFQSAAKVIARQKKDNIFAAALRDAEDKLLNTHVINVKKELHFTTNLQLGNLRVVLTDAELPVQFSRGDFAIQDVKLSSDFKAKEIDSCSKLDWIGVATSGHSEWTLLFGVRLAAITYSELANDMENVIEPWELAMAVSSSEGENGFAVLTEAEKRLQINVTPSLLKMYRALNDLLGGDSGRSSWLKHQEAVRTGLISRTHQGEDCLVQNLTGCKLYVKLSGENERLELATDERGFVAITPGADGQVTLESIEIEGWGKTPDTLALPQFGVKNVRVLSSSTPSSTLFVSVYCRLEDPQRQRIVLKSNLYICNHSSESYDVKYLTLGNAERAAVTSDVISLSPGDRTTLPLPVLMGITEVYARPSTFTDWVITAKLNDDILTSPDAIAELDEYEKNLKAKQSQRRGAIVYGDTQENCSKMVKQLSPSVVVRRWHLRTHMEWEMSFLPPFLVRNSLPYKVEYRFMEYKIKSGKSAASDFAIIERTLRADSTEVNEAVLSGRVHSGQDAEVAGISSLSPGYLSVRLIGRKQADSTRPTTPWSKPLLMAIHGSVEHFATAREEIEVAPGVKFSLDRATLPNLPRLVRLSCPYWVVNNSALDLMLASAAPGAKPSTFCGMDVTPGFEYPRMVYLEHNRLSLKPVGVTGSRPPAWSGLGYVPTSAYTGNSITDDALKSAAWSESVNSTTVNTTGEVACGRSVFGVKIEGLYGAFEQSISLTVSPRFFVQNRLKEKVFVQAFGSSDNAETTEDKFRKRTADEAKNLQVSLQGGETIPLMHFSTLKQNDPLNNVAKYISMSFSEQWSQGSWSNVVPISSAGDVYLQLYSPLRKRHIICMASVQIIEQYVYVILSDSSGSPPFRIENFTPFKIDCSQLGEASSLFSAAEKEARHIVESGVWYSFAWHDSLAKDHKLEVRLQHNDGRIKEKKFDINAVGYHESMILEKGTGKERIEVVVQTIVDEGTRVLKFVEKELEMSQLESQDAQFLEEFEQRKMLFASSFDIRIAGFGLSLFDTLPQEVLLVSVDVIQIQKPPASLEWDFSIFHSQIDNMLPNAKFPVVLNPVSSGFSDRSIGKSPKPLVKFVLDADLAAKVGIYKLLEFQLSDLAVKVDLDYVFNLLKLLEPFMTSDTAMQRASLQTLERVLHRQVPPVPVAQLTDDGNIRHDVVYYEVLRLSSISIDLEYSITRKDIVTQAGGAGSHSVIFGLLTQVIGLIGSNLSGSPSLSFSEIVITRCFTTKSRLQSQLIQNFVRQAVMQAYRLVGSADIIGNPIGLVEDLGSGVIEFLKITKDEVMGDSQTRGEGVKVLGKTIVKSGASTVAKITGSLDKFVGDFAEEEEEQNHEAAGESPGGGGFKFAKDLGKGLTGIFTKPVEGAMKGGVTGLVQGAVQGIAGPGVVLLKQITSTSHNLALGVQSTVVDRSPFGGRRRHPKKIDGSKVVADFDEHHYRSTRLLLEVVGAQGLLSDKSCDPTCVVRVDDRQVLRTRVLYNTLNPMWQEKAQIELNGSETEVQFVVKDSFGGAVEKTIGKCIVSMKQLQEDFRAPEFSSNLSRWVKTGVKPEETKKNVSNSVKEKEYTLLIANSSGGGAASLLGLGQSRARAADDDYQVLLTVIGLRDLQITSSSGGGVLGLGNLVSSTPNISPYVSVHVGKGSHRTNTGKMKFAGGNGQPQKGSAEWNETFTFPVTQEEVDATGNAPAITLSLKDRSMLHDETLGYATRPLQLKATPKPTVEELELFGNKEGTGDPVGWVKVKVEVISATSDDDAVTPPDATLSPTEEAAPCTPLSGRPPLTKTGSVKAGKVRIACEFV
ncbi:hypothetical protein Poli38472_004332 [Pythium oligandrum]|uniref:Calmodulin n=1 Tax=Pythium oligandrum TaxID=41045 RepID=A0A8K1FI03_PYTOL|nr:hypothetical protein Poli38472_004332 [Pythium oligandrum]|eukprot:TMW59263.1 hypothetical protein Poli38472_004332 [Pythium oligandrum]